MPWHSVPSKLLLVFVVVQISCMVVFMRRMEASHARDVPIWQRVSHHEPYADEYEGYDIVTTIHHDDMDVFIEYGMESFLKNLIDAGADARIFCISTLQAHHRIQELVNTQEQWQRVISIPEYYFPFQKQNVKAYSPDKDSWVFQQVLKLYSHRVISSATEHRIHRAMLLIDSDTVLTKPLRMIYDKQRLFYNMATLESGAFENDVNIGHRITKEILGTLKAIPDNDKARFTVITHHMMFDGRLLEELLEFIEDRFQMPAWQRLANLTDAFLTEWELYLAFVRHHHPEKIALRQLPYVNWGKLDKESLGVVAQSPPFYLTKHDDWGVENICCVNAQWVVAGTTCKACPWRDCLGMNVTCSILQLPSCEDTSDGYMIFTR